MVRFSSFSKFSSSNEFMPWAAIFNHALPLHQPSFMQKNYGFFYLNSTPNLSLVLVFLD
ncbi:hypothetical protein SLEP1_g58636 [Rubroshorea leprosula]|uniref:Uncharacterized protein n=1 Tax=Rubroshorea leprosula TaxID=152421 RepID=A0AAV5MPX2_9ROSI|nr:hypothetical protein SLEP1_g58636 [Rubroshorea leprosula]